MTVSAAESISRRFKLARENAGLSQTQAAKLASIRRPAVAEIESGRRRLSAEEAARFAKIYRVSVSWLTCAGTETPDPTSDRIELAARELARLSKPDLDRIVALLATFRQEETS